MNQIIVNSKMLEQICYVLVGILCSLFFCALGYEYNNDSMTPPYVPMVLSNTDYNLHRHIYWLHSGTHFQLWGFRDCRKYNRTHNSFSRFTIAQAAKIYALLVYLYLWWMGPNLHCLTLIYVMRKTSAKKTYFLISRLLYF